MNGAKAGGAMPNGVSPARWIAGCVLERVLDEGAYASRALDAELSRAALDPRDAALATEIVYGSLRVLPALDARIAAFVTQDPARMDGFVRAALRCAAYQLAHLGRVPAHAIVDETVSIVRAKRNRLAGFANAVLRRLAASRGDAPEPPRQIVAPGWIDSLLSASLGAERAAQFLSHRALPPPLCLRVEGSELDSAAARERLSQQIRTVSPHAEIEPCGSSPLGLAVRRAGSPRSLPGYREGVFSVQEEGSQLIGLALGVRAGERIADVCAGHGGKSTLFARQVGEAGQVIAIDRDERKLEQIGRDLKRIGLPPERVEVQAIDLTVGLAGLGASFDRVLVDAPCSGLGTVHRRPELLHRLGPEDPGRLARLQLEIVRRAAQLVRPGGVLAYAVCSPAEAEGAQVARGLEQADPGLRRRFEPLVSSLPKPDPDGVTRIGPWFAPSGAVACPDAYQLVLWERAR